ncbi:hypothetical protein ACH5AJ_36600 [Streptomyces rochei]|uniref:hypothetical protein n=1 Tax=Streptomyces rochei TaxID=1928 RepID=UPI0037A1F7B2
MTTTTQTASPTAQAAAARAFNDELVPEQPDGIEDDSWDLPDPHRAAERVGAWIAAWGDGLIDTADGHPLYARDLEALRRAVAAAPRRAAQSCPVHVVLLPGCPHTTPVRAHRDEPPLDRPVVDVHLPAADITA